MTTQNAQVQGKRPGLHTNRETVKDEVSNRMPSPKAVVQMAKKESGEIDGYAAIMPVTGRFLVCEIAPNDHRPVIVELLGEYDLYVISDADRARRRYVVSIGKGSLGCWTVQEIANARNKIPGLTEWLCEWMLECQSSALSRIADHAYADMEQQVQLAIVRMMERFGFLNQDGSEITMDHVTHEMFGWYIGSSREMCTQKINDLRRKRMLSWHRGVKGITIDIHRWNGLVEEPFKINA